MAVAGMVTEELYLQPPASQSHGSLRWRQQSAPSQKRESVSGDPDAPASQIPAAALASQGEEAAPPWWHSLSAHISQSFLLCAAEPWPRHLPGGYTNFEWAPVAANKV